MELLGGVALSVKSLTKLYNSKLNDNLMVSYFLLLFLFVVVVEIDLGITTYIYYNYSSSSCIYVSSH